jgi:hypothetical protein
MKLRFIVASILAVAVSTASADVIVNNSNKASPGTVVAKTFETAVGTNKIDFFQANTCEEAQAKFQSSKNAVMIYNADVGIAALGKGLKCPLTAKPEQTVFIGKSYLKVCTSAKAPKTLEQAKTIGAASVILSKGLVEDYNSNGLNLKGVPYGGSVGVLGGLIAGDIDVGFVASSIADPAIESGQITCALSTDPRRADYVANKYKLKVPSMPIVKVFYTNTDNPAFISELQAAVKKEEFQAFLAKAKYDDVKTGKITQKDLDAVQNYITDSYNYYWK